MTSRTSRLAAAALLLLAAAAAPARAADKRLRWEKSWGPMVPHKSFPRDCGLCHLPKRWDALRPDFRFDHLKETGYPLLGAHATASCLRCHNDRGPIRAYTARGCGGCHVDPHRGTLGIDCTRCHDQNAWSRPGGLSDKIVAHARTRFPLNGMHAAVDCRECHLRADMGEYRGLSTDCIACHEKQYATAPNHQALSFPTDCRGCHTTVSWPTSVFNHSVLPPGADCYTCHAKNYQTAPNHLANSYPTQCSQCHNTSTWLGASFNHAFLGASPNCYGCHSSNYQTAPNHVAYSFATACLTCHTGTATWLGATYDHSPLGANPTCWTCHQAEYASAKATAASNHAANSFPTTCADCHTFSAKPPPWGPGTAMNHNSVGGSGASCAQCHASDYSGANSPVAHSANSIPTTCYTCHASFSSWYTYVHSQPSCFSSASFSSHQNASCRQCHPGGSYGSYSCTACHSNRGPACN